MINKLEQVINKNNLKLPSHLQGFIVKQRYDEYTAQNQAVWRYIMRNNINFLSKIAHKSYINGLKKTGIFTDYIPKIEEMNQILQKIGWAAVTVDGFIPPNAFMEFQSYQTLVIAVDIRNIEHIDYTPAPDIVHEAAGHAPIIANPEYAEYLRRFGEIGAKAISSAKDYELYEAIRHLSILKEDPKTTKKEIDSAEKNIEEISLNMGEPSEMARIRNLHWWTVEYGLLGTIKDPKIYGAGLLSSIGESKWCMSDQVKKIPYSIVAADISFDITKPQPQLFVSPDFAYLSYVLEEFANRMALRKGGLNGVKKLIDSKDLGTIELSTGIQISGIFTEVLDHDNTVIYIKTTGPTALAFKNKELIGHDKEYHSEGFGSPIGKLKGINLAIEDMSPTDLEVYGIYEGENIKLQFEGGIIVEGKIITGKRNLQGKIILISFKNCTVKMDNQILFKPEWGIYDMAIGRTVVSAFSGVADPSNFDLKFDPPKEKTHKINYSKKEKDLHKLYAKIRKIREDHEVISKNEIQDLKKVFDQIKNNFSNDWLLPLEIYELIYKTDNTKFKSLILNYLENNFHKPKVSNLIKNGLQLIQEK